MGEQTTAERIEKQLNDIHDTYPGSVYDCFRVIANEIAAEIDALRAQLRTVFSRVDELDVDLQNSREIAKKYEDRFFAAASQLAEARQGTALANKTIDMLVADEAEAFKRERAQLEAQLDEARAEVERVINANDDERRADAEVIAGLKAEIDALTADLRTANAEIARLMPLPEIYTLWKKIIEDGNPSRDTVAHFVELAHEAAERAAAAPADLRTPTDQRIAALEAQLAEALAEIERLRPVAEAWEAMEENTRMSIRYLQGWESAEARNEAEVSAHVAAVRARAAKVKA